MAGQDMASIVDTAWLAEHISAPDVRVVDGSYYLPHEGLDPRAEYQRQHIPGAVFFDIDDIAEDGTDLPHMLPSPIKFSSKVRKLGLGDGVRIVVYDQRGIFSAPRVWWTFRYFGHNDVAVLDGGLPKWLAENRPVTDEIAYPRERHFTPRMNSFLVRDKEQMQYNLESRREQVLDARPHGRFEGTAPEPRPGLRSGHIPGSKNMPHSQLLDPETQTLLAPDILRRKFEAAGIDLAKPVVTTCGSGITAAVLALGLNLVNHRDVSVYDGSWAEWGAEDGPPLETGQAR
jgi:thiosulfate/3-mercaptopyruvate sulfurtransferase